MDDLQAQQAALDTQLDAEHEQEHEQAHDASQATDAGAQALEAMASEQQSPAPAPEAAEMTEQGAAAESASEQAMGSLAAPGRQSKKKAAKKKANKKAAKKKAAKKKKGKKWTGKELAKLVKNKAGYLVLSEVASRDTKNGIAKLKAAGSWDTILNGLPQGDALPKRGKIALFKLVCSKEITLADAKKMFEKRFKHAMTDSGGSWTLDVIAKVWKQLRVLPESDVTNNTVLTTFQAIAGTAAYGPSWEDTANVNTIQIGEGHSAAQLPHTVRHEVGHGVHAQIPGPINDWLKGTMEMWFEAVDDGGIDSFVADLGGYPAKYQHPDTGADVNFDDTAKSWIRHMVKQYTGSGGWDPGRATPDETEGPWPKAMWAAMDPKLHNACAQSTSYWYNNYTNFQKGDSGNRLYLNHYYHTWFKMSDKAAAVVAATGDNYTAMSEKEFFANAYAEYFKDPKGKKDNTKWGGNLTSAVKDFFKICVVERDPYNKFQLSQKKKET